MAVKKRHVSGNCRESNLDSSKLELLSSTLYRLNYGVRLHSLITEITYGQIALSFVAFAIAV
jgi:hypothetical protein